MVLISLLPIGLMQAWASVEYGTWYARSAEFMQNGLINNLRWARVVGDSFFAIGAMVLGWFVVGLVTGHSYDPRGVVGEGKWSVEPAPAREMGD
jgi:nitric oxide reductase subunit B